MPATFQIPETHPDRQPAFLQWAAEWTGSEGFMHDALAIGAFLGSNADGFPDALCVLQNRISISTEIHFGTAGGAPLTRGILQGFFAYAFHLRRAPKLIAPIRQRNVGAQMLALKSGFLIRGYQGSVAGEEDVIRFEVTPDTCRWLLPLPALPTPAARAPAPVEA